MQIASTCKGSCPCDKCELFKENVPVNGKLNQAKCQTTNNATRPRAFARSRPAKSKTRYTYGGVNHHRLDHTYAAAKEVSRPTKPAAPAIDTVLLRLPPPTTAPLLLEANGALSPRLEETSDEISLKSTWLRNLCLEYQPAKKSEQPAVNREAAGLDRSGAREKHSRFQFSGVDGAMKQYQRNRKAGKNKTELASTFLGKSKIVKAVQEDKERWIAALALMELAQSK